MGCGLLKVYYYGSEDEWYNISKSGSDIACSKVKFDYVPTINENGYEYYVKDGKAYISEYTKPINAASFTIADRLGGYPVKMIETLAFPNENCHAKELIIPKGIEELEERAFMGFIIEKAIIPSMVSKIGAYALESVGKEFAVSENNKN